MHLDLVQIWQAPENSHTENAASLQPPGHHTENEKPIRIDSLTKLDLADVLCMEYMSAEESSTYLLSIDSLLPFWSNFSLQWQDWKLKGKERTLEKFLHPVGLNNLASFFNSTFLLRIIRITRAIYKIQSKFKGERGCPHKACFTAS